MPVATLLPTSDESSTGTIVYSSGSTAFNLLDDDDDDSNHIGFDSNGFISLNFQNMPKALGVNYVIVRWKYAVVGAYDGVQAKAFVKIGGTKYYGGDEALVVSGSTHVELFAIWYVNPATGEAWTTTSSRIG